MKLFLVEPSVALLALNPRVHGMTLAVMVVGQACFSHSQKRAAIVVTMESILCGKELPLTILLHLIIVTLFTSPCLLVVKCYYIIDGGMT